MNAINILDNRCIAKFKLGSHLYGTNTPTSDMDYGGLFIPPKEALLGLSPMDEINDNTVDKQVNGKNTQDAVDVKYYSLHKFARLALQGNPSVLEMLFVPPSCIEKDSPQFRQLCNASGLFVSMNIVPRFLGYAHAQKHKMILRSDKWAEIHAFHTYLQKFDPSVVLVEIKMDKDYELFGKFAGDVFAVGDLQLQRTMAVKKARAILQERIDKGTNRQDNILKHAYDTKFGSHLLRLMLECRELLQTGKLVFPLTYAPTILDVKEGKRDIHQLLEDVSLLEDEIRNIALTPSLPKTSNFKDAEKLVIEITEQFI
jgi:uncharacterized protein